MEYIPYVSTFFNKQWKNINVKVKEQEDDCISGSYL